MTNRPLISVVLPVFNEDRNIQTCLRRLAGALEGHEHELLVCYDFDADTTLPAIAAMPDRPPTVRLVKNGLGRGAANALRAGFLAATGDVVVTTMADLSDPPEKIPELAQLMRSSGAAVVAGSRYMRGGTQNGGGVLKTTLSRLAGLALHHVAGVGTHDATNNFKAYSREFLRKTPVESTTAFDIALELTTKAHRAGDLVLEVPSSWTDRSEGESRFRLFKWLPGYLRWFEQAMRVPVILLVACIAMYAVDVSRAGFGADEVCANRTLWALYAGVAIAMGLWARRLRGRCSLVDLVHVALWQHPFHADAALAGHFASMTLATLAASMVVLAVTTRRGAWWRDVKLGARSFTQGNIGLALFIVIFALAGLDLNEVEDKLGLDPSWREAYPYFAVHGLQAGIDYIFTYGPLGFIQQGVYNDSLFFQQFVLWSIFVRTAIVTALVLIVRLLPGTLSKTLWLILLFSTPFGADAFVFAGMLAMTVLLLRREWPTFPLTLVVALFAAFVAMNKFTYFIHGAVCMTCVAAHFALRRSKVSGALVLGAFVAFYAGCWMLEGQHLANLPQYFHASLEVADGYSEAMSRNSDAMREGSAEAFRYMLKLGVILGALIAALALVSVVSRPRAWSRTLIAVAVGWTLFVCFKAGFVRQLGGPTYFSIVMLAPFLIPLTPRLERGVASWIVLLLRVGIVAAAFLHVPPGSGLTFERWSVQISRNLGHFEHGVWTLDWMESFRDQRRKAMEKAKPTMRLARVIDAVGDGTIDVLGVYQQYAIHSDLHYTPRPVFQSYSAYTPWLVRKNAEFYFGEHAPDFVLFHAFSLDEGFATQFDGPAMRAMLMNYEPRLVERQMILFERNGRPLVDPDAAPREVLLERTARMAERIDVASLGGECQLAYVDVKLTTKAKLMNMVLHVPPALRMTVFLKSGRSVATDVVRRNASEGFILNPYLETSDDWIRWITGGQKDPIVSFAVHVRTGAEDLFEPTYAVRIERADELVPKITDERRDAFLFPMMHTRPTRFVGRSTPVWVTIGGEDMLFTHAPSSLVYDVPPGRYEASAHIGMLESSYEKGATDGVTFRIASWNATTKSGTDSKSRHLDPKNVAADRGVHTLTTTLDVAAGESIVFSAEAGPKGDIGFDYSAWGAILVKPVDASPPPGK